MDSADYDAALSGVSFGALLCQWCGRPRILSQTFGEETSFNVVSNAMPGVTRRFHSFSAALQEVENARVFGGIHFRTACVDGTALGISVGDYVSAHALLPTGGGGR